MSSSPGVRDPTLRLLLPEDGITAADVVLRSTTEDHMHPLVSTTR
jgi:hypothetical protein